MAHCQDCGCNKLSCGCKDTYLTTPPPCPTPEDCPDAQPCSEVFDAQCIIYTGADITCDQDLVVTQNSSVSDAIEAVVNYFCAQTLNTPITVVEAGTGISVTSNTVGATTTYTVTNSSPATSVALTSSGGDESLVNDGTGPALAVKGLTAGQNINLVDNVTYIEIQNVGPQKYVDTTTLAANPASVIVTHNFNTLDVIVSVTEDGGLLPYAALMPTADYTYDIIGLNSIQINAGPSWVGGNIRVTVIG